MPIALTIAGSDPGGGAGIQSDLRTFHALGVTGTSALSAITIQNTTGVSAVYPVEPAVFRAQISTILKDTRPDAIKIGMLGGADQVAGLCSQIERSGLKNIVLDTVLASTGGTALLDMAGRYLLMSALLPLCDLITPNIDEASALTGMSVHDDNTMIQAGEQLLSLGAKAVLIKGGHKAGSPTDWLLRQNHLPISLTTDRVDTEHTHGTGCLLSSAIAAFLARGADLAVAVSSAKEVVYRALSNPTIAGKGRGYPTPYPIKPMLNRDPKGRTHDERLELFRGIYVVTDPILQKGRSMEEVTLAALAGGAQIIQLRDKTQGTPELIKTARKMNQLVRRYGKLFIVNDRVDVALASDADGVHLGLDDMHPRDVRDLLGPDKLVGVSTGTVAEAVAAAPFASYFGVGCIFGTKTKHDAGEPIGPRRIAEIKAAVPGIPTVAIGGISAANIRQIVNFGATSAAVVSAIVGSEDIQQATRELVELFN